MIIDQIIYPVESLGPGKRVAIWLVGCKHRCKGCSNPELWEPNGQASICPRELFQAILRIAEENPVDGITITGGEPFDQAEELLELVSLLHHLTADILVFSGYYHKELISDPVAKAILEKIAVLVDGPYIEDLNKCLPLRGSSNQHILLFDKDLKSEYDRYLATKERRIQNFYFDDQIVSVGIHDVDFKEKLDESLVKMKVRRRSDDRT